jgi:hypothetical protein
MADVSEFPRTINAADMCRASFWRSLAPGLHIGDLERGADVIPRQGFNRLTQRIVHDGYFGDSDQRLETLAPSIGKAIKTCVRFGLPPVMIWAYDEPWECFRRLAPILNTFLGRDYKILPDFWAWHIDHIRGEAGWGAHRDKDASSLTAEGLPLSLTCWIPLSDANPMNGCMYIVPAYLDPHYKNIEATPTLPMPQSIRALPAKPGDFLMWNQAVLHWGGLSSEFADEPRMSMALEFQRGDIPPYGAPLLDHARLPSFGDRVRLIAKQILQYTHMYGVPEKHVQLAQFLGTAPLQDD